MLDAFKDFFGNPDTQDAIITSGYQVWYIIQPRLKATWKTRKKQRFDREDDTKTQDNQY